MESVKQVANRDSAFNDDRAEVSGVKAVFLQARITAIAGNLAERIAGHLKT